MAFWGSKQYSDEKLEKLRDDMIRRIDELRVALRVSLERQIDGLEEIKTLQAQIVDMAAQLQKLNDAIITKK
jgi:hypothetical protein